MDRPDDDRQHRCPAPGSALNPAPGAASSSIAHAARRPSNTATWPCPRPYCGANTLAVPHGPSNGYSTSEAAIPRPARRSTPRPAPRPVQSPMPPDGLPTLRRGHVRAVPPGCGAPAAAVAMAGTAPMPTSSAVETVASAVPVAVADGSTATAGPADTADKAQSASAAGGAAGLWGAGGGGGNGGNGADANIVSGGDGGLVPAVPTFSAGTANSAGAAGCPSAPALEPLTPSLCRGRRYRQLRRSHRRRRHRRGLGCRRRRWVRPRRPRRPHLFRRYRQLRRCRRVPVRARAGTVDTVAAAEISSRVSDLMPRILRSTTDKNRAVIGSE